MCLSLLRVDKLKEISTCGPLTDSPLSFIQTFLYYRHNFGLYICILHYLNIEEDSH